MRRWFALACVIGGCWRNEPPIAPSPPDPEPAEPPPRFVQRGPEPGSFDEVMGKMGEFRDKMCVCSDKTCADAVTDEMTKWSVDLSKRIDKHARDAKPNEDQIKQMTSVTEEFSRCMTSAMTAGSSMGTP
jgi:hypothetical protein